MSTFKVEVVEIDNVMSHPNADRLELAIIRGWQTIVPKGKYSAGDNVVYVPVDAVIPENVSEYWGIAQYLKHGYRTKAIRLRGEMSYGLVVDVEPVYGEGFGNLAQDALATCWVPEVGEDVAWFYGIKKFEEPQQRYIALRGQIEREDPRFFRYTDIENYRNLNALFQEGEEVFITEKVHGTNSRVGIITHNGEFKVVCGSRRTQRKLTDEDKNENYIPHCFYSEDVYRLPLSITGIQLLLIDSAVGGKECIVYGEVFGKGIQDMDYGRETIDYVAFDIMINGVYLDYPDFISTCDAYGIPRVPILYEGPFNYDIAKHLSCGISSLYDGIKEGIVIRSAKEMSHPKSARKMLKLINDDYLIREEGTEFH